MDKTDRTKGDDILFYNLAGQCYVNAGEFSKALVYKRKALDLYLQEYTSATNFIRFSAKVNAEIADLCGKLGNYDEAIKYLNASLDICRQQNQLEHEDCANVYFDLGTCYLQKKDYPEALINFEDALKIREKIYGPNEHALLSCHIAMVECYKAMGNQEKLTKHLDDLNVIAKIISKKNETGRKKLKERLKEKAGQKLIIDKIKKQKKELKANGGDLSMIRILNEAEVVGYAAFGDKRKALKGLKKLFEESHKEFNEISHEMADKYYIHGIVYRNLGMYEESCSYFKKSWTIYRNVGSIVDDDLKKAYYEYGIAYLLLDQYEEARAYCEKGVRLNQLDSDHMLDPLYCRWDDKLSYVYAEDE